MIMRSLLGIHLIDAREIKNEAPHSTRLDRVSRNTYDPDNLDDLGDLFESMVDGRILLLGDIYRVLQ